MSGNKFFRRVLLLIISIVTLHVLGIEFLIYFVTAPSFDEFVRMLLYPLPLVVILVAAYCVITYFYLRPPRRFLDARLRGEAGDEGLIQSARDRSVNLAYFLPGLSFPAYVAGGAGGVYIVGQKLGWPPEIIYYGLFAGIIAGLLTAPISIYAAAWATRPVLERTLEVNGAESTAVDAGLRLPLRAKLTILVVVLVAGITGYALLIAHGQARAMIQNMEKMEGMLPASAYAELTDVAESSVDPRVKSSKYYQSRMGSLVVFFAGILIVGVAFAAVVGLAAANEMARPLQMMRNVAHRIRDGDYEESVKLVTNDEFVDLADAFNKMTSEVLSRLEQGRTMLKSIEMAVNTLSPMSKSMVAISEEQATSSLEKVSAAEEAASSSEEIAGVARQIAENADRVAKLSEEALQVTEEGRKHLDLTGSYFEQIENMMQKVNSAMEELGNQSREIGEVAGMIDNISDHINLLALNASLEAVGAHEHGRRFGVVANEVERLARNSADSTRKINDIITRMQQAIADSASLLRNANEAVGSGKSVIGELGSRLGSIFDSGADSSHHLKEINMMTSQQATASEQMAKTIGEIMRGAHEDSMSANEIQNSLKEVEHLVEQLSGHLRQV